MKREAAMDLARVLGMLAVLMAHVSSAFVEAPSALSLGGVNAAFYLNQASRFAVPLFFVLSGWALSLRDRETPAATFYRKRLGKLLPPFLLWSLLYLLLSAGFRLKKLAAVWSAGEILRIFLLGEAAPHLYFIVVLLQLSLLFPLLQRLQERHPRLVLTGAFVVTILCQIGFAADAAHQVWYVYAFPTWLFYFCVGMKLSAGGTFEKLCCWCEDRLPLLLFAGLLLSLGYTALSRRSGMLGSVKPELTVYTVPVLLSCLGARRQLDAHRGLSRALSWLSDRSMTVYFCHVAILNLFRKIPFFARGMRGMLLLYLAVLCCSVLAAWGMNIAGALMRRRLLHIRDKNGSEARKS